MPCNHAGATTREEPFPGEGAPYEVTVSHLHKIVKKKKNAELPILGNIFMCLFFVIIFSSLVGEEKGAALC